MNGIFKSDYLNTLKTTVLDTLSGDETEAELRANTVTNAGTERREDGFCVLDPKRFQISPEPGWLKRTANQQFENETTRRFFLEAVLNEFDLHVSDLPVGPDDPNLNLTQEGLAEKLPKRVRDALKLDDYGHLGRPLSLFRIKTVMAEITRCKQAAEVKFHAGEEKLRGGFAALATSQQEVIERLLEKKTGIGKGEIATRFPQLKAYKESVRQALTSLFDGIKGTTKNIRVYDTHRFTEILMVFRDKLGEKIQGLGEVRSNMLSTVQSAIALKTASKVAPNIAAKLKERGIVGAEEFMNEMKKVLQDVNAKKFMLDVNETVQEHEAAEFTAAMKDVAQDIAQEVTEAVLRQVICEIFLGDQDLLKLFARTKRGDNPTETRFVDAELEKVCKFHVFDMHQEIKSLLPAGFDGAVRDMTGLVLKLLEAVTSETYEAVRVRMDGIDRLALDEIARMAYGSGSSEGVKGGRGFMGLVADSESGATRIVKYDTHALSRSTADKSDPAQLAAANALRRQLLDLADKAELSQAEMENVRLRLGLDPVGEEKAGTTLLTRKDVAKVVGMIDGTVWGHLHDTVDRQAYSTKDTETSFAAVVRRQGGGSSANRAFAGSGFANRFRPRLDAMKQTLGLMIPQTTNKESRLASEVSYSKMLFALSQGPEQLTDKELAEIDKLAVPFLLMNANETSVPVRYVDEVELDLARDLDRLLRINALMRDATGTAIIPDDVVEFLLALPDSPTFAKDAQGKCERNRIFKQLVKLSLKFSDPMYAMLARTNLDFVIAQVNKGFSDPLPFGMGQQTSDYSPARKDFIRRELARPSEPIFTMSPDEFDSKYGQQCHRDCKGGMGLVLNGVEINGEGKIYGGNLKDFCAVCRNSFADLNGNVDEKAYRLAMWIANQGTSSVCLGFDTTSGARPAETFYSPTGICLEDSDDMVMGTQRHWGFVINSNPSDNKLDVSFKLQKTDMRSVPLKNIAMLGGVGLKDLHSHQKPLKPGENYQRVDVSLGYQYQADSNDVVFSLNKANSTYEFQDEIGVYAVTEENSTTIKQLTKDVEQLAVQIGDIFTKDGKFKDDDFDAENFKTWIGANKDAFIGEIADLDHGNEEVFTLYTSGFDVAYRSLRYSGARPESLLLNLMAMRYAIATRELSLQQGHAQG